MLSSWGGFSCPTLEVFELTISDWLAAMETTVEFTALLALIWQLRVLSRQLRYEAVIRIYEINRALIAAGLKDPDLLKVLDGRAIRDKTKQRRFLQQCFNQIDLTYLGWKNRFLTQESWEGLERDIQDFSSLETSRQYWRQNSGYYSREFQAFLNRCIEP